MKKIFILVGLLIIIGVLYYVIAPVFDVQEVDDVAPLEIVTDITATNESEITPVSGEFDIQTTAKPAVFEVMSTTGHPASGQVRVIETTTGQVIRFENFKTINGPNLHLYLSKDIEGKEFIDLGPIRGTEGNINYEVPEGIDLAEYKYVMHWCVPFGVLFNYAQLL